MTGNLIQDLSPFQLEKKIRALVDADHRALPPKAKVFAAIADLQGFTKLPRLCTPGEIEDLIAAGGMELQRGIAASDAVPALLYARELARGTLHPGTKSAYGHGIYLATPSAVGDLPDFPRISEIARHYARSLHGPGIILRSVLRNVALPTIGEIQAHFREERNRARRAGIVELGAFAAACGFRGYRCEGIAPKPEEEIVVVLDRTALVFQRVALQIGAGIR